MADYSKGWLRHSQLNSRLKERRPYLQHCMNIVREVAQRSDRSCEEGDDGHRHSLLFTLNASVQ